jgi:hypothetical protein
MSPTPTLFDHDPTAPRHHGNPNSVAAHESLRPVKPTLLLRVLEYVRKQHEQGPR